jgi:hypothetical protein
MKGFYKEQQRFTQWWLWMIILASLLPVIAIFMKGMYVQFIVGEPWGDKPMSDTGLILRSVFIIAVVGGVIWLLLIAELIIEIHDRAVYYSFTPFIGRLRRIGMEDIVSWKVRKYNAIGEYGGYGWRKGFGKKTAYIVKGRIGLEMKLKNGKKLMLGTQQKVNIMEAMEFEMEKINNPDYQ